MRPATPEADFTPAWGEYFLTYLQSDEAKAALADALDRLLEESGLTVSAELLENLIIDVTMGYQEWAESNPPPKMRREETAPRAPGTISAHG